MGIFIHLNISDTITTQEWEKAYQKSVKLMEKMPLIEETEKNYYDARLLCATKTVERIYHGQTGWHTIGDSISMKTGEDYFLPKYITSSPKEDSHMDPYMSILSAYSALDSDDARCNRVIELWGNKTQAEPYHFYLLAVACMLEHELPGKAAVYGDITKGQCKKAVQIASDLLGERIEMPDRCDLLRLYDRVRRMPLQESEIVYAFVELYLGNQGRDFGVFIQKHFSEAELAFFWRKAFGSVKVGTYGFTDWLKKYLLWGFQMATLKEYVQFNDEKGNNLAEEFVKTVLRTEVFIEEKDCEDVLEIDKEEEGSYSIHTLLVQFAFAGAKNHRVDRYIPLEELSAELSVCVGDMCDVSQIVAEYMAECAKQEPGSNPTDQLIDYVRGMRGQGTSSEEEYDISDLDGLMSFQAGNTISPSIHKQLSDSFVSYRKLLEEKEYHELLEKEPAQSIRFLIDHNDCLLLMEEEWQKIFNDMERDITTLERYYPMARTEPSADGHVQVVRAIVLNDQLYQYCLEHLS